MWQISRIYLDSIGTPAARFVDFTLDLADAKGRPLDSILWLRNGGGKSTVMALIGALIRPGRNDFLSATEHRNDVGRHLEDYVLGADTGHVVVEWRTASGRRLVTGAVYEWTDRVQPNDPNSAHDRLVMRWYAFRPDGDRAELARLPFRVAGRATHLEAFTSHVRSLPAGTEPVVARTQTEWERTLTSHGIDPDLWRTILQMNESEGGIEHQFLFADADEFVRYVLRLIIDPEIPNGVAKILGQVISELAARPEVEADLRFCEEAIVRLTELDGVYRTAAEAAELVRIATDDARALRAALLSASEAATHEAHAAKDAAESAQADVTKHRSASDVARTTGNEYARLAAVLRERDADQMIDETQRLLDATAADRAGWAVTQAVADEREAAEQQRTLEGALRAAEADAAPLAERRAETSAVLSAALAALIETAKQERTSAIREGEQASLAATAARQAYDAATRREATLRAEKRTAEAAVERFERDLAGLRANGSVGADETVAAALDRHVMSEAADAAREVELRAGIAEASQSLAVERSALADAGRAAERAATELRASRGVREDLHRRRDALRADPRIARHLPDDEADLLAVGSIVAGSIDASVRSAGQALIDLALDGADDARALAGIESSELLPAAPDLIRARETLAAAGISAVTGWTYLADAIADPARRLTAFLGAPDLAAGLLVQDPGNLGRAREILGDAGLRPTSLVAVGTTADLEAASRGDPARHFAVPPNAALYDRGHAADERARREEAAERRGSRRDVLEAERATALELGAELAALLRDAPPARLRALDEQVERHAAEAERTSARVAEIEARIEELRGIEASARNALDELGARRRETGRRIARLESLAATEVALAGDRALLLTVDAAIAGVQQDAAAARSNETAAADVVRSAGLIAQARQSDIDRFVARRSELPRADAPAPALPAGWSLDVLDAAYRDADRAYVTATSGSAVAAELVSVERRLGRIREELEAADADAVGRARELLATPDGQSIASRARAASLLDDQIAAHNRKLGELRNEKRLAAEEAGRWEVLTDRNRQRIVEEPASVDEAKALEATCRQQQEAATVARQGAEERAREAGVAEREARVRANTFADQANTIEVAEDEPVPEIAAEPFAGSEDAARQKAREVSRSLAELRKDEEVARRRLDAVATRIGLWAGADQWATVKAEVRSRFRTGEVADELGPIAGRFRDDQIELRRVELAEHLRALDEHRTNVVSHAVGMVRVALRSLSRFSKLSELPDDLGDWSRLRFIEVGPKQPVDDGEAVMADRVGRAVDGLIAQKTASVSGMELLWLSLREVVGPPGFRARVLKPSPTFSTERTSVDRMRKWSGGEKVTMALLLFVTVAKLRAALRGKDLAGAGALMLDNPLGKANYVLFLDLQRRVAAAAGVQLIFLTGVGDMKAVGLFPNVVRMRNAPDRGRGRGYVAVIRDGEDAGIVSATRVYRVDERPALPLG